MGDWKLVALKGGAWELYDLKTDRAEQHDLAAQMPDKVKELEQAWQRQTESFTELARRGLTARVATFADGQKYQLTANDAKASVQAALPFSVGVWQETRPVEVTLAQGRNVLALALP